MPPEGNKIFKYNHGEKSIKAPFIIYADLDFLLKKFHSCQNNPETENIIILNRKEKLCIHLLVTNFFTTCSLDSIELHSTKNKLDCYRGKDFIERFC